MSKSSGRRTRRVFSSEFKAKVALAALRESCSSVSRNAVQVLLESVSKCCWNQCPSYRNTHVNGRFRTQS